MAGERLESEIPCLQCLGRSTGPRLSAQAIVDRHQLRDSFFRSTEPGLETKWERSLRDLGWAGGVNSRSRKK